MKFKTRDLRGVSIDKLKFTATGSNELADANAEVIENVNIRIPKFTVLDSPGQYYLSDNYPNPFNNLTRIEYGLKNDGYVSLKVYNVLGEVISELVNAYQKAGHYNIIFDGNELSEGVYFYKILINNNDNSFSKSRRMVISR